MNKYLKTACLTSPILLAAFTSGCVTGIAKEYTTGTAAKGSALQQAASCDDLLWQIQTDATAKLDHQVGLYKENGFSGGGWAVDEGELDGGDDAGAPTAGNDGGEVAPGVPPVDGSPDPGENPETDPDSVSQTNTQVKDVDEADIVKADPDGKRLYVLHGSELKIVDSWPADQTKELGKRMVPGQAFELFVSGGKATVFSTVAPTDLPDASGDAPPKGEECVDCCYYGNTSFTEVSVYDVSGDVPELDRELIFEGNYLSSRRHGDVVRAVVQGGFHAQDLYSPNINPSDTFGNPKSEERLADELDRWRDDVAGDIKNTTLEDWIPRRFERIAGEWKELDAECGSYFVPAPGLVAGGVTQVVTLDGTANEPPQVTSILGGAEHVYANTEVMVLAQTDWRWDRFNEGDSSRSSIHQFRLDGASTGYEASGFAPGYLKNQFAIDERAGVVRLSTTEDVRTDKSDPWFTEPRNTILTMQRDGKSLVQLGRTEPMGEEGETIYSTRFLGDRAYVVTFRQTDPLYVVDMSQPDDLVVLGELHIPGFSEYIHPLGLDHLLTIGMDTDPLGEGGVALQLFDVTDPLKPKLAFKESYGGYSSSEANYNHKAFTYVEDYFGKGSDLLLFPLVSYAPEYTSGLEVLKVSKEDGFTRLGTIDHAALINNASSCPDFELSGIPCYYYGGDEMRRGVQIDDYIYALSQGGLTVHSIDDLTGGALATVSFDPPSQQACFGGGGGIGMTDPGDGALPPTPGDVAMGGATSQ
jgi:hypothetical protein